MFPVDSKRAGCWGTQGAEAVVVGEGGLLKHRQYFPDLCGLSGRKTDAVCRELARNVLTASAQVCCCAATMERTSPHVQFGGTLPDISVSGSSGLMFRMWNVKNVLLQSRKAKSTQKKSQCHLLPPPHREVDVKLGLVFLSETEKAQPMLVMLYERCFFFFPRKTNAIENWLAC